MKLIILLIALGLERYLHAGQYLYRFNWFHAYLDKLANFCEDKHLWRGYIGLAINILPVIIIVGIVCLLFSWIIHPLFEFIFAILILLYSLGPTSLFMQLEKFLQSTNIDVLPENYKQSYKNVENTNRLISSNIFILFNSQFFAVIFWFVVLGPLGALFYRLIVLNAEQSRPPESKHQPLHHAASMLQGILDWIPVRLLGVGYALVGDFGNVWSLWFKNFLTGIGFNNQFNVEAGLAAVDVKASKYSDIEENRNVFHLVERTLIFTLVIVAIFTLGAWIY
ncbi:MAG: regulatory signaling modulator protein AmpE [Pseudomonadota bacterium]